MIRHKWKHYKQVYLLVRRGGGSVTVRSGGDYRAVFPHTVKGEHSKRVFSHRCEAKRWVEWMASMFERQKKEGVK